MLARCLGPACGKGARIRCGLGPGREPSGGARRAALAMLEAVAMPNSRPTAELDDPKQRRRLPLIGLMLSVLYLIGLVIYLIVQEQNPADLRLNELGDFLGGVASPLAFLWLVLGFFQQSREIRLSARALHLQASELRASRERAEQPGRSPAED
jgi:hypothetical protein